MTRVTWPMVALAFVLVTAIVLLEETGKAVPAWLAGAGGSLLGYALRWVSFSPNGKASP